MLQRKNVNFLLSFALCTVLLFSGAALMVLGIARGPHAGATESNAITILNNNPSLVAYSGTEQQIVTELGANMRYAISTTQIDLAQIKGYTTLDYIKTTGTQYIDTEFCITKENVEYGLKFMLENYRAGASLYGVNYHGSVNQWSGYSHGEQNFQYWVGSSSSQPGFSVNLNVLQNYNFKAFDNHVILTVNDTIYANTSYTGTICNPTLPVYLSCCNEYLHGSGAVGATQFAAMRIYGFSIKHDNILVRDFVPVIQNTDNAVGMLDRVNHKFYRNKGTGTFGVGATTGVCYDDNRLSWHADVNDADNKVTLAIDQTYYVYYYDVTGNSIQCKSFRVVPADISTATVTVNKNVTFNGAAHNVSDSEVSVLWNGQPLENGTDYEISTVTNNTNAGTATVTIAGKGKFTSTATGTFTIKPLSLSGAVISPIPEFTFNGSTIEPELTVKVNGTQLGAEDYKVTFTNHTNAGTASYLIEGMNNYTGNYSGNFVINKKIIKNPQPDQTVFTYNGEDQTYHVIDTEDYLDYNVTDNVRKNAGDYIVTVSLKDARNCTWEDGTYTNLSFPFTIAKQPITKPKVPDDYEIPTYDGNEHTYPITVPTTCTLTGALTETNAGNYPLSVEINDKNNYMWTDGTFAKLNYNFVINQQIVDAPNLSFTKTMLHDEETVDLTEFYYDERYTIEEPTETIITVRANLILYLKLRLVSSNYIWSTNDLEFYRSRFEIVAEFDDEGNKFIGKLGVNDCDYLQTPRTPAGVISTYGTVSYYYTDDQIIADGEFNLSQWTLWTNAVPQNAGKYYVIAYVPAYEDYYAAIHTDYVELNIRPYRVTAPAPDTTTYSYTGELQTYNLATSEHYSILGLQQRTATPTTPHKVTLVLHDQNNFVWNTTNTAENLTYNFWIYPAPVTVTMTICTKEYDGLCDGDGVFSVAGALNGDQINPAGKFTWLTENAGETLYKVTDLTLGNDNYYIEKKFYNPSTGITPCVVSAPENDQTQFVYNSYPQTYQLLTDNRYNISDNQTQTNAGDYTIVVSLKNTQNYCWAPDDIADKYYQFKIAKAVVTLSVEIDDWYFGDEPQQPTAIVKLNGVVVDDAEIVYNYSAADLSALGLGDYTIQAMIQDHQNYCDNQATTSFKVLQVITGDLGYVETTAAGKYTLMITASDVTEQQGATKVPYNVTILKDHMPLDGVEDFTIRLIVPEAMQLRAQTNGALDISLLKKNMKLMNDLVEIKGYELSEYDGHLCATFSYTGPAETEFTFAYHEEVMQKSNGNNVTLSVIFYVGLALALIALLIITIKVIKKVRDRTALAHA